MAAARGSQVQTLSQRHGAGELLMFPPLQYADDPRFHDPILQHPLLEDQRLPMPSLEHEVVQVPDQFLPLDADLDSDTLPTEQHPSYPYGNPYVVPPMPHTLQPSGSSQPKIPPRVYSQLMMHAHGELSQQQTLTAVARGSASAQAAVETQRPISGDSDNEEPSSFPSSFRRHPSGTVELAPHLKLRAQITTAPAAPSWPFKRFGPGPCARPGVALFRSGGGAALPETAVWADFALDQLVPGARPDSYTLPSNLQHPYTQGPTAREHGAAVLRGRARPSDIPPMLGAETAKNDRLWLDDADASTADLAEDEDFEHAGTSALLGEARRLGWGLAEPAAARAHGVDRTASTTWMDEKNDFHRTLLAIHARKEKHTRTRNGQEPSVSSADYLMSDDVSNGGRDSPPLELPASTLQILNDFYNEQADEAARLNELASLAVDVADHARGTARIVVSVDEFRTTFGEQWQLSQFWYSAAFTERLAAGLHALLDEFGPHARIAFISCPTAYVGFQHKFNRDHDTYLFEIDDRFTVIAGDQFVKYDFNRSDDVPADLAGTMDVLVLDPPFLNMDTNVAFSDTARYLVRRDEGGRVTGKTLLFTGQSIGDEAAPLYSEMATGADTPRALQRTALEVQHAGGLANDFGAWGSWPDAAKWAA
ncbi:Protein-lysine N-methyltransferase efm5 [Malassezia sp. CBS 17886]|nr:Protein-lysine N-methyltransferase efm5 [Malassezia sp. CBS 17886]